jgi:glycosyltransferase involved in cell wall biosynthesis
MRRRRPDTRDTVLLVAHVGSYGGSAVSLRVLLRHLGGRFRVVLAGPVGQAVARDLVEARLVDEVVPVSLEWRRRDVLLASTRIAVWAMSRRKRIRAIHANGLVDLALATPAATLLRLPVVVWVHDAGVGDRRVRVLRGAFRFLLPRIKWVGVSRAAADALERFGYVASSAVEVVPNPIEAEQVVPVERVDEGPVLRVGFLGTDTTRKGFDTLPETVRLLDGSPVKLLVFARHHGRLPDEIERSWDALEAEPVSGTVEIVGHQIDVRGAYARCDVVLCPSREESFCRVVAEAMLNGIPVVATSIPAIEELVGGEAGILVPPGDAREAARAIERLAADPALRRRLGEAGRRRASAFAPDLVADRFAVLYERAGAPGEGFERARL